MAIPSLPFSMSDINSEFGTKSLATHFSDGDGGVGSLPGNMSEFEGLSAFSASLSGDYGTDFDVATDSVNTSAAITASISSGTLSASISGTGQAKRISVNGGPFTVGPTTVSNGQTIRVRQTASSSYSTSTTVVLDLGGYDSATYTVITEGAP